VDVQAAASRTTIKHDVAENRAGARGSGLGARLTVLSFIFSAAMLAAQSGKRVVQLEVFPTKEAAAVRVVVRENETLITTIKELGTLGFEVRFRDRQEKTLLVVVFDAETSPHTLLGATEVPINGQRVPSNTSPSFGLRIRRIEEPR
jgi:hypothetical protein